MNTNEPYITIKQACKYLNIGERSLRSLIANRKIPYYRYGYPIMFKISDLEEWVQKHKVNESEPEPVKFPAIG